MSKFMIPMRIALGHQARVGKDTFMEYFNDIYGCSVIRFAEPLYLIATITQATLGKRVCKDPSLMQRTGDMLKQQYGQDVFIDAARAQLATMKGNNIIAIDMRCKNELAFLREAGFTTVKITRGNREIDRDHTHISEVDLADAEFDYTITNDGTKEEFYAKIEALVNRINAGQISEYDHISDQL
jgi:dephospho-CoA kinase